MKNHTIGVSLPSSIEKDADVFYVYPTISSNDRGSMYVTNDEDTQSVTSVGGPMLLHGAHCINSLNWKNDNSVALASENMGARFYDDATGEFLREEDEYCGAQIDTETGALTTTLPEDEELDIGSYPEGVQHRYDYAFWYRNLQTNVDDRISAFFNQY